jgi:hypothetical protein
MGKRFSVGHKLPVVFIACPYDEERFRFSAFKGELELLPWTCLYANTSLHSRHLLETIRKLIIQADFSLFDLSGWNANVALELGLAHGVGRKPYYILSDASMSNDVPSDIKGLQRIDYLGLSDGPRSLRTQLINYFFASRYHPTRTLWKELHGEDNADVKYVFALQVLAYLREHSILPLPRCDRIASRLGLDLEDWNDVCDELVDAALLVEMKGEKGYRLRNSKIFKRLNIS